MTKLYVSPTAEPEGDGTLYRPFSTIQGAQRAVRVLIAAGHDDDIVVYLRGGFYPITETLVFGTEDSFCFSGADRTSSARSVTYIAFPDEQPILSSGVPISGWEQENEEIPGLPKAAEGKLWSAPLPMRNGKPIGVKTLYDGYRRMPRARTAGFSPPDDINPEDRKASELSVSTQVFDTIAYPEGAMRCYENLADAELLVRPTHVWVMNLLPIAGIDEAKRIARTTIPATYPMYKVAFREGFRTGEQSAWVENVFDGITAPGKWVADTSRGRIYLWPRTANTIDTEGKPKEPAESVYAPHLTEIIRVDGMDGDTPVENLFFEGLTFAHTERITWDAKTVGLQHDWDLYDSPNAMVRFRGAENCAIRNCAFTAGGGVAVRLDLHCIDNRIEDNAITGMGGTGILLAGYGPGEKDVNHHNSVAGNHISCCGELFWMSPGIFVWQSGNNRIVNNLIHDLPYDGIVVSGPRFHFLLEDLGKREQYGTIQWGEIGSFAAKAQAAVLATAKESGEELENETLAYRMSCRIEHLLHARCNIVEENELHNVLGVLADGDAIYFSGTGRDNVVRRNYIHDVVSPGTMAHILRMDGMQYWTTIEENVIFRSSGGIAIRALCNAVNNYIIDVVYPPESYNVRRRHCPIVAMMGAQGETAPRMIRHNLYYQSDYVDELISFRVHTGGVGYWQDVVSDENLFFSPLDSIRLGDLMGAHRRSTGQDEKSVIADPMFVDLANGDFRMSPESPAFKLGIKQIDLGNVGLRGRRGKRTGM